MSTKIRLLSNLREAITSAPMYQQLEKALPVHILGHVLAILITLPIIGVTYLFFPSAMPIGFWDLWSSSGSLWDWLWSAKWVFLWAVGVNAFLLARTFIDPNGIRHAERVFKAGFWVSLSAGFFEEVTFRWLRFLAAFPAVIVVNWILGGFLTHVGLPGWGLVELLTYPLSHVANFFTLGYLADHLVNAASWTVPAALIAANNEFRDGHKYQGPFGWTNSWFMGMVFFYFTFTYGLLAAIVVHFLYDLFVFATVYADMKIEDKWHGRR